MATIDILASTLLDDYEIAGPAEVTSRTTNCGGPTPEHYANLRIPIRRKPVLIRVVLDVTGPKRRIECREYFLNQHGNVEQWQFSHKSADEFIPLSNPVQVTK